MSGVVGVGVGGGRDLISSYKINQDLILKTSFDLDYLLTVPSLSTATQEVKSSTYEF